MILLGCGVNLLAVPEILEGEKRDSGRFFVPFLAENSVFRKGENIKIVIVEALNHLGHCEIRIAVG